jgi:hypothetical protein
MQTLSANVNSNIPNVAFNDLYLDVNGNISLSFDIQAALQACAQAAQTLLGEMVFNINQGIPYFQTLWVGVPNIQQFTAALRMAFLAVPNVVEVISLVTSQQNDNLTYSAIIRTSFGSGTIANTIEPGGTISG